MATEASGAGIPWWDLPDYARAASILAAVVCAAGLGTLLARALGRRAARRPSAPHAGVNDLEPPPGRAGRLEARDAGPAMNNAPPDHAREDRAPGRHAPNDHEELPTKASDPVLRLLHRIMHLATYVLAIAMVVVILEGVVSVIYTLYLTMSRPPFFMVPDIVKTFGAFLAVLIAYEIFANITLYIRSDVFPVKLVVATAVMAVARKIIVLDMDDYTALDLVGIGAVVLGLGVSYWLISLADARCGPAHGGTQTET